MSASRQRKEIEQLLAASVGTGTASKPAPAASETPREGRRAPEPIAIVGLSGYFPSCMSHGEFWRAVDDDRCLIEEIPADRFRLGHLDEAFGEGSRRSPSRWGGFIPDIKGFDWEFFGLLPGEAELLDPQLRLLLMSVYHTLEDAGHAPATLRKSRTGVFVGFEWNEYLRVLSGREAVDAPGFSGADTMIANQISYHFENAEKKP